jgi:capsular exopolysaccharide synthesis family protein
VKIINRAYTPVKPVKPDFLFNFVLAVFSGLLTGITLAFLIEHLDRSIKTPEEAVKNYEKPLFARIPKFKRTDITDTDETVLSPMLMSYFEPKSIVSEQFKMLMINTKFGFTGVNGKSSSIMVNSADAGEGKSLITANLAITYALAGYKTIIVDADFHRPGQHKLFNIDNFHGLTDIMLGEKKENLIKATQVENLNLLPSGAIPPSPAMFFESYNFSNLIESLKKDYDIVLVDIAPTSNISDSLLIVPKVDNILFVISVRHTDRSIITKTLKDIDNITDNPVGLVCNNVSVKNISGHYYKY